MPPEPQSGPVIPAAIPLPERLEGARVVLRPYDASDAATLMEAVEESREHLRPWMPFWDDHRTVARATEFCAKSRAAWITRHHLFMVLARRSDGRHLGGTGFQEIAWDVPKFEIGYWIRASEEGRGYVGEAVRLLARFGMESLHAQRIEIRCDPTNARSVRVAERAGFRLEATLQRDARRNDGSLRDTRVYSILAEERRPA